MSPEKRIGFVIGSVSNMAVCTLIRGRAWRINTRPNRYVARATCLLVATFVVTEDPLASRISRAKKAREREKKEREKKQTSVSSRGETPVSIHAGRMRSLEGGQLSVGRVIAER